MYQINNKLYVALDINIYKLISTLNNTLYYTLIKIYTLIYNKLFMYQINNKLYVILDINV